MKNPLNYNKKFVICVIIIILSTLCFYYYDIVSNVRQGINFWKALFEGNFLHYYSINVNSVHQGEMGAYANYSMITNFIMGIWQLPLYIIEKITSINTQNYFIFRVYSKLYLVVASLIANNQIKKIANKLGFQDKAIERLSIAFLTSGLLFVSVCLDSQIEIVSICLYLLAINAALSEDKKRFFIYFLLAFQCKYFAIFILIPILLMLEKNLIFVLLETCATVALHFLVQLPFQIADPEGYSRCETFISTFKSLFIPTFDLFGFPIPISVILYLILCLYIYTIETDNIKNNIKCILYGTLGLLCFINSFSTPYRMVMIVPLLLLLIFNNSQITKKLLLTELICELSFIGATLFSFTWCYDYQPMRNMLIDKILPLRKFELITIEFLDELSGGLGSEIFMPACYGLFIASVIFIIVMCLPTLKLKKEIVDDKTEWIYTIRAISCVTFANLYIVFYVISVIRNIIQHFIK